MGNSEKYMKKKIQVTYNFPAKIAMLLVISINIKCYHCFLLIC